MHELNYIWTQYFWASLKGNGPEALIQTIVYGIVALIVIPPLRHWVSDHVKGIHAKLNAQHEEHLRLMEVNHKKQMDTIAKNHKEVLSHVKKPIVRVPKETPTKGTTNERPVK